MRVPKASKKSAPSTATPAIKPFTLEASFVIIALTGLVDSGSEIRDPGVNGMVVGGMSESSESLAAEIAAPGLLRLPVDVKAVLPNVLLVELDGAEPPVIVGSLVILVAVGVGLWSENMEGMRWELGTMSMLALKVLVIAMDAS